MAVRLQEPKPLSRRLWEVATSRKVAVVLLLAVLLMLLLGLWLPQVPRDLDAAGQSDWWAAARVRYGERLELYQRFGLTNLPGSFFFLALLAALLLNTLLCTLDRFGRLWREALHRPALHLPDEAYAAADWQAEGIGLEQARQALRRFGARLHESALAGTGRPHYFFSENWRLAPLGTVLTHLALFLLALAALLHSQLAWSERQWVASPVPGTSVDLATVYDPGVGPFVAGGVLLSLGGSLGLLFPHRRLWARWEEGRLQVRLGVEEAAAPEEVERLARRLPGGTP